MGEGKEGEYIIHQKDWLGEGKEGGGGGVKSREGELQNIRSG